LKEVNVDYVVVATTRPETMLGDVAVAVNPKDERYSHLKDKMLILPIIGRELKIIFDNDVDPSFGTGALKVTPAHDPIDFELGIKHSLDRINVMDKNAAINSVGGEYEGMDRFECRKAIIEDLKKRNLFIKLDQHLHAVGHCYRCHTMVEPRLSKQWFVKMKPLSIEAINVVKNERIKFYPARWTKVYLNWMENIRDWCISRQIWWGHRIPVWYCKDCKGYDNVRDIEVRSHNTKGVFINNSASDPDVCPVCGSKNIEQDPDVLDTWFSSWLWPFSTMGWPEETELLKSFYPTDALVTAQEIIFFWVARMIMAGLKFCDDIPFKDIYIHGTVRDASGTKMSKSLGNVIDPLDIIKEVGSDALRFSIISITSQGQDVFLSKDKFEFGRNFANKVWNASRFVLMNIETNPVNSESIKTEDTLADKWILNSFDQTAQKVNECLTMYKFNEAAAEIYDFFWHKFCDWYLELSKLSEDKTRVNEILLEVLSGSLKLLHPFMPFITEEIWQKLPCAKQEFIVNSEWPIVEDNIDQDVITDMGMLINIITSVRNARSNWNLTKDTIVDVDIETSGEAGAYCETSLHHYIEKLAKCKIQNVGADVVKEKNSISTAIGNIKVHVKAAETIDVEEERKKIQLKIEEISNCLVALENKLDNKDFISKAPQKVVDKELAKKEYYLNQLDTLKTNLDAICS
ncbi:MAG: valine--tRNA ligase, partial [Candidatus Omnitrophica bacterium]|nr:valine--tRNA ligase [Candidatus Omnitrophota bacterium]